MINHAAVLALGGLAVITFAVARRRAGARPPDAPQQLPPRLMDALAADGTTTGQHRPSAAFWNAVEQQHPWLEAALDFDAHLPAGQREHYDSFWQALWDQGETFWRVLQAGNHQPWQQLAEQHHVVMPVPDQIPGAPGSNGRIKRCDDRGSVTAEMAVFAVPTLVLLAMFIVFCGRAASAAIDVRAIAAAAARAAADAPTAALAPDAADRAAADMASGTRWACTTATDTTQFYRGGTVAVTVTCVIELGDLGITGVEDTKVVAATAIQPVDTFRTGP